MNLKFFSSRSELGRRTAIHRTLRTSRECSRVGEMRRGFDGSSARVLSPDREFSNRIESAFAD